MRRNSIVSSIYDVFMYLWQHVFNLNLSMFASGLCTKFLSILTPTFSKLQSMLKTVTELGLLVAVVITAR